MYLMHFCEGPYLILSWVTLSLSHLILGWVAPLGGAPNNGFRAYYVCDGSLMARGQVPYLSRNILHANDNVGMCQWGATGAKNVASSADLGVDLLIKQPQSLSVVFSHDR